MAVKFKTADGVEFTEGSLLFSHYTMRPHMVLTHSRDGWFDTQQYELPNVLRSMGRELLDGSRLCSLDHAQAMGWISEEQVNRFRLEHQCPKCWDAPCRCEG